MLTPQSRGRRLGPLEAEHLNATAEHILGLMLGRKIPWLVQVTQDDPPKLPPVWDTIEAPTSKDAALLYATTKAQSLGMVPPFWVHVGPAAPGLRYDNGFPHFVRSFRIVPGDPQLTLSE